MANHHLEVSAPPVFPEDAQLTEAQLPATHHQTPLTEFKALVRQHRNIERFFAVNASLIASQMKHNYERVYKGERKPCVLLAGTTGSGKSSVVNAVFGVPMAEVGIGKPLTQFFAKFELDNRPITLFDAKGLEAGEDAEDIIREQREFLEKHKPKTTESSQSENPVDVVWYVINSACARFQPFEARLLKELFCDFPIIILLNKADISTEEDKASVRQAILDLKLPNLHAVVYTISDISRAPIPAGLKCPKCGGEDVTVQRKLRTLTCGDCRYQGKVPVEAGLEKVMKETTKLLTRQCAQHFIAAQKEAFDHKDDRARDIILRYTRHLRTCRFASAFLEAAAEMLGELSVLWDFRYHERVCAQEVVQALWGSISYTDQLFLLLNTCTPLYHEAAALAILWTRAVRSLTTQLTNEAVEVVDDPARVNNNDWVAKSLVEAFDAFDETAMRHIVAHLNTHGVEYVLDKERFDYKIA